MCGIVGSTIQDDCASVATALDTISHRGPDSRIVKNFGSLSAGFVRLSILEIEDGEQPLEVSDINKVVIFNGEIYNYRELRAKLEQEGAQFVGRSEAEVLARGYEHWGRAVFNQLRGMYAVVIWDTAKHELLLARDPLGKKPLYWSLESSGMRFASEIKALWRLSNKGIRNLDINAVFGYLITDSCPAPRSIDQEIKILNAGSILHWSNLGVKEEYFWTPLKSSTEVVSSTATNLIAQALRESVRRRLISHVPLGLFLSGGIDSRVIASEVAKETGGSMSCFTLKFDGNYDESREASRFAEELGFELELVEATAENLASMWFEAKKTFDEPLNDPAALPMMLLSQAASKRFKAVLTGDGGDELFLGYPHMKLHSLVDKLQRFPFLPVLLSQVLKQVPDSGDYFSLGFKAQRMSRGIAEQSTPMRDLSWRGAFLSRHALSILHPRIFDRLDKMASIKEVTSEYNRVSSSERRDVSLSCWYLRSYLLNTVLTKVDRASMKFGLECRSPLLDLDFVETVLSLRRRGQLEGLKGKEPLKEILSRNRHSLPIDSKKHGMGVPVMRLLRNELRGEFERLTAPALISEQGIFSVEQIEAIRKQVRIGIRDVRKEAWSIFAFQGWLEKFGVTFLT